MTTQVQCYCGDCKIVCEGQPIDQACCHCIDCRRWGGASFQSAKLFPVDKVKVISGSFLSKPQAGDDSQERKSCAKCGGAVLSDMKMMQMIMVPAGLFETEPFTPNFHIMYASRIMDVKDGLPKFKDWPAEMGGSGERLADSYD